MIPNNKLKEICIWFNCFRGFIDNVFNNFNWEKVGPGLEFNIISISPSKEKPGRIEVIGGAWDDEFNSYDWKFDYDPEKTESSDELELALKSLKENLINRDKKDEDITRDQEK